VHPGGPSILRSVSKALKLPEDGLAASYAILAKCGNMSSPTIFFVLSEYLRAQRAANKAPRDLLVIAFGPGLTIEIALVRMSAAAITKFGDRARSWFEENEHTHTKFVMQSPTGRSFVREVADFPIEQSIRSCEYNEQDVYNYLRDLNQMHKFLFYNGAFYRVMRELAPRTVSEVGCGGGFLAGRVAAVLPQAQVLAVDRNRLAIDYCRRATPPSSNLTFAVGDDNRQVDVIYVSDVIHHMDDTELVPFLTSQYARANKAVVILDLHRHWLAILLFFIPGLFITWVARVDGYRSIKRAFKYVELYDFALRAGVPESCIEIQWIWPFRWLMVLRQQQDTKAKKVN